MNPDKFDLNYETDLYGRADSLTDATRIKLPHHLDISIGDHPKQKIDLYLPAEKTKKSPVLLFLHGGGFQEGDRSHYGFIAAPYAEHGIITAIAGYRLTSDGYVYPSATEDVKNSIAWLFENIESYGGDKSAIYVSGHSAGAILAAEIGVDLTWLQERGIPLETIRGIVSVSGRYDFLKMEYDEYLPTRELKIKASAIHNIRKPAPEFILSYGTTEDLYIQPSNDFYHQLVANHVDARIIEISNGNHIDTVFELGTADSELFNAVLGMIK